MTLRIELTSLTVPDQAAAADFYTKVLGFRIHTDEPVGEYRWLTLTAPGGPESVQLLLEPEAFAPAASFREALFEAGIPSTAFTVDDLDAEHARLEGLGVRFTSPPTDAGPVRFAVLDDRCGHLIQLLQHVG